MTYRVVGASAVGDRRYASFRFFQRVGNDSPDGELAEIVSALFWLIVAV